MERERRYCMRFIRPYFSLEAIKVYITISNSNNSFQNETINYTLEEKGYPNEPTGDSIKKFESNIRTGEEEKEYLINEWNLK